MSVQVSLGQAISGLNYHSFRLSNVLSPDIIQAFISPAQKSTTTFCNLYLRNRSIASYHPYLKSNLFLSSLFKKEFFMKRHASVVSTPSMTNGALVPEHLLTHKTVFVRFSILDSCCRIKRQHSRQQKTQRNFSSYNQIYSLRTYLRDKKVSRSQRRLIYGSDEVSIFRQTFTLKFALEKSKLEAMYKRSKRVRPRAIERHSPR